ncbi:MAG: MFS transporter [Candidatus Lokiarchaeota archaeon]|nr:MFS transporter [Candidatus Lokiarchaeota archaeon]
MPRPSPKEAFLRAFTITVFLILASIDNCVLDMASSVYWAMQTALVTSTTFLGFVNSLLIWIVSGLAIWWGYLGDKGNRKRLLLVGTLIWSASLLFTPLVFNEASWVIVQCVAGVGLACIASVGFSVIVDFVAPEKRGMALGFWGLSQGAGTAVGKGVAAILVTNPSGWWQPFFLFAIIGFIMIGLYFFTLDPKRGATEAELKDVDYEYTIKTADFKSILKKKTNILVMLTGMISQIFWGALTWLPFIFYQKFRDQGLTEGSAGFAGNVVAGLFAIGGIFSIPLGWMTDKLLKRTLKARPLVSGTFSIAGIPLFISMLLIPFDLSALAGVDGTLPLIGGLINQLGTNPPFLAMFLVSIGASALISATAPNWFAMIGDVNLPEHRGTMFGLGNFINGVGRGIGSLLLPQIAIAFLAVYPEPWNYLWSIIVALLFFIPMGILCFVACKTVETDYRDVKETLARRAGEVKEKRIDT